MIARAWRGWTTQGDSDREESGLRDEVFPGIEAKGVADHRRIQLLCRDRGGEGTLTTIIRLESLKAAKDFVGEDLERACGPAAVRALPARFDARSRHHEVGRELIYPCA